MARHPDDVQLQLVMVPWMRRALGKAAMKHQDDVDRHKLMERGPMSLYILSWFLAQDDESQLRIIEGGKAEFDRRFSRRKGLTADPDSVDAVPAPKDSDEPAYNKGLGSVVRKGALPESEPKRPKRAK